MSNPTANKVFAAVDAMDAAALTACMTPDAVFRFSNHPPVAGHDNIRPFLEGFFASIKAISHSQLEVFELPGVLITNGVVTYTRHNGTRYQCYFSNTFKMAGNLIAEYLIFVDNSKLYDE